MTPRRFTVAAANAQLGFVHPNNPAWAHFSFCEFAGPPTLEDGAWTGANVVAVRPSKVDRWPTGTGCTARMAALYARGQMRVGDRYVACSIIGSAFHCQIEAESTVGGRPGVIQIIAGQAWIIRTDQHMLDPTDPYAKGYRLSDTWSMPPGS